LFIPDLLVLVFPYRQDAVWSYSDDGVVFPVLAYPAMLVNPVSLSQCLFRCVKASAVVEVFGVVMHNPAVDLPAFRA
jgi:hypothetical protein